MLVVDIDGDGSFLMTSNELATAAQYQIPVKVVILNNDFQGMVRQWQELFFEKRYVATEMVNPSFSKVAEAFGCTGIESYLTCDSFANLMCVNSYVFCIVFIQILHIYLVDVLVSA